MATDRPIKWTASNNIMWFVVGENGSLWCSTASFTRRGAIANWEHQTPNKSWRSWYRGGFRCKRVKLRYQVQ